MKRDNETNENRRRLRKGFFSYFSFPSVFSVASVQLDRIIAWGLAATIVFAALAHGAIEPWSAAIVAGAILFFVFLWSIRAAVSGRLRLSIPSVIWPIAALAVWSAIQGASWTGENGRRISLSLDPDATRGAALWIALLGAAGLLAVNFWTQRQRLRAFAWFITVFGFLLSVFALIQKFTWNGRFYWIRPGGDATAIFGPFINHNLYAGYMELLAAMPVGLLLARAVRGPARLFCAFAAVIMSVSIIFSLSRGGMISLAALLIFIGVMSARRERARSRRREMDWDDEDAYFDAGDAAGDMPGASGRRAWLPQLAAVGAIFVAILAGLLWLGPDTVASRLTQGRLTGDDIQGPSFYASRGWIWKDTWDMFRDRPLTGVGLGAYETAFPRYTHTDGTYIVRQAHNDYLQILADGGVAGAGIALWFLAVFFRAIGRGAASGDPWVAGVALGAGAGAFGVLVHSIFDFNLQIPGTALLFVVLVSIVGRLGDTVDSKGAAASASGRVHPEIIG
ncbi:MAG: O-antigen ligase family protein [Acidobacteria bacterium]|nr:O-antigen ligase family protein [Acidobacteriota bacterium]